ncbi:GTP-binding protein Di-Ras2-like [Clytia hemisphaerica]
MMVDNSGKGFTVIATDRLKTSPNGKKNDNKGAFKCTIKTMMQLFNHRKQVKKRIQRVTLSVIVLGTRNVGKTSLIRALCGEEFTSDASPTVLDVYTKENMINNMLVKFEFIDLSASHSFPAMRKLYIQKANIFFLLYDNTRDSFKEMVRLKDEIEEIHNVHLSELPIAVIKTKCDSTRSRTLPEMEVDDISHWCGTLFACSAKKGVNIAEIEEYLLCEGCFADTKKTTTTFERNSGHRVSGRYIYGGRRRSKSVILNRTPERPRSSCSNSSVQS